MIHKITGLPMLSKVKTTKTLSKEELQKKTLVEWDDRALKISRVTNVELRFSIHIIAHKIYSSSQWNNVPCEAVDLAYKIIKKNLEFDLLDVLLKKLNKNTDSVKTSKNNSFKFGSLLTCLFFYVQKFFPSKGTVVWRKDTPIFYQINEFIREMGDNYEKVMNNYFEAFKEKMNNIFRIPPKLVEDYKDEVCFMVDYDKVYIQAIIPRVAWVKALPYEINMDEAKDIIEALINEPAIPNIPAFGTYEEAKKRIELNIKIPQAINRGKKRMAKMAEGPLMLTEGKGEDEEEELDDGKEKEETPKKKGKVIITKPQKQDTAVFT